MKHASIGVVLLLSWISLYAQLEPTVMLRGTVRQNEQGISADLLFRDDNGKTIRAKSANDGSYQTVLAPGKTYTVTITNENLERYTFTYTTPPLTKYTELTQDFALERTTAETKHPQAPQKKVSKPVKSKKAKRKQ